MEPQSISKNHIPPSDKFSAGEISDSINGYVSVPELWSMVVSIIRILKPIQLLVKC
jgi:hypothetical protein